MADDDDSLLHGLDPNDLFGLGHDSDATGSSHASGSDSGQPSWQPPSVEEVATLFPRWKILGLLGRGGMGAVYHAHQPDIDREVAVKLLPIETSSDEAFVQRFQREARTLAKLRHPGIVALHEFGTTPAGHLFFVMEYVDGLTLAEKIGRLSPAEALEIIRQCCEALCHAHSLGIVHRDLKPSNILIDTTGQVKIADFGLAKWQQTAAEAMTLSRTGMFLGTPDYAAPEQVRDAAHADHRADIYSLGVLFYEMLTGERPRGVFEAPSSKSGSDPRLDAVVMRALRERPEQRYQHATQLREEIARLNQRVSRLPWLVAATALIVAATVITVLLVGGYLGPTPAPELAAAPPPASQNLSDMSDPSDLSDPSTEADPPAPPATDPQPEPRPVTPPTPAPEPAPEPAPAPEPVPEPEPEPEPEPSPPATVEPRHLFAVHPPDITRLTPPSQLTNQVWQDAVLHRGGGAFVTADDRLLVWIRDHGAPWEIDDWHQRINALTATPDAAFALTDDGTVLRLPNQPDQAAEPLTDLPPVDSFGRSSHPDYLAIVHGDGGASFVAIKPGLPAIEVDLPDAPALRDLAIHPAAPGGANTPVAYALTAEGLLHRHDEGQGQWRPVDLGRPVDQILPGDHRLAVLTDDGRALLIDADPTARPRDLETGQALHLAAGDGFIIVVEADGRGLMVGQRIGAAPRRLRLPSGNAPLIASPDGLVISL